MRRRSTLHRAFVAVLTAILLLAYGGEASVVHWCPMHDGPMPVPAAQSGRHAGAHDAHHAANAGHQGDAGGDHKCRCLGDCSQPVPAALPGAGATWTTVAPVAVREAPLPERGRRPTPVPHALPFANGPPAPGSAA